MEVIIQGLTREEINQTEFEKVASEWPFIETEKVTFTCDSCLCVYKVDVTDVYEGRAYVKHDPDTDDAYQIEAGCPNASAHGKVRHTMRWGRHKLTWWERFKRGTFNKYA